MGLSRQGAQKQLDRLTQAGLVTRAANDADARAPLYRLTPKGQGIYDQLIAAWRVRSTQLAQGIDEKSLLTAAKALHDIADAVAAKPQRSSKPRSRR
jgi:DNA-binding MarR family transcriptional regulator